VDRIDEMIASANSQLGRIKALCARVGLQYVELADGMFGVGAGIGFGEAGYVILSIMGGGNESKLMITSGILKDIKQDRLAALTACNSFTRENTLFPVFLHDAQNGWSLLVQLTYTVDLMLDNPEYFELVVRTTPKIAAQHRAELAEKYDLGGRLWQWTGEDVTMLLAKSLV
jgi:hypothetical protein